MPDEIETLIPSPERGLSDEEVARRKKDRLINKKKKQMTKSYGKILFDNVCNPFNLVLVVVTGVMIWGRLSITHFVFAGVLTANIIIGVFQDIHARKLTEKLQVMSGDKCVVLRNGEELLIDPEEIVLSDIIILKQGDQVPADGVVRKGQASLDESLLSGESEAVLKEGGGEVLSGSFVKSGRVVVEVTRVGKDSYAEKLRLVASGFKRPKSEIAQSIWNITVSCSVIATVYAIAYVITTFLRDNSMVGEFVPMSPRGSEFIASLSGSMVAMLPTGMFLLTSIALTAGVIALAKKGVLVQELYCLETLARADVVCFDKTGTLTDGNMSVYSEIPLEGADSDSIKEAISLIIEATDDMNATALALKDRYGVSQRPFKAAIPFDSERKYSAATSGDGVTYVIGAYGRFDHDKDEDVEKIIEKNAKKGYRCLVLAKGENEILNGELKGKFHICAVLTLLDHIKPSAKENIAWFQANDVDLRIISGDNPITVAEIARQCGVNGAERCVDLTGIGKEEIPELLIHNKVFGRVNPEQKEWIVRTLQRQGHKVAMTGDGVNDVLALKQADCAIAMASGAASAKNVSHLVCTKSDFSSLPDVVAEGRRVINNLQRSCSLFLSKTVFAIIVSLAFLISAAFGGNSYPFTTSHMLVWEIFSIGMASFFLALQPNNERIHGSMMNNIFRKAIPAGLAEASCVGAAYFFYAVAPGFVSYNPSETYIDIIAISIIAFSAFSYVTLFVICRPFNKYRSIVFGMSLALGLIVFVVDFFVRVPPGEGVILRFMWGGFAWSFPLALLSVLAIAIGVYALSYFLLNGKKGKRNENRTGN